jgi:serine/threonine-protein kinase
VTEPQPLQADRVLHGRYRLVAAIAAGGMAEVWEGVDEVLTRPIAVKLLHPHLAADEGFRERFRREAVAAARLAHANVVATFDTGEDEGNAFIVMELIRGRTLRDLVSEQGALPPALVASIGMQVADALDHAHTAGLVHRDVKPANILVCDADAGSPPQIKVADFGIARAASHDGADLTQPGALLGTAKYLAPELVEGAQPDARSDIYGLGVVLYELLTGRPPFVGDTEMATAMAHIHNAPLKPRQLRAGIPRSLEAIVTKAMAKDPNARHQSAAELASALRGVDLGDDDAVPAVVRDPTPPAGIAPTFRETERTWLVPAAIIFIVAAGLVALGIAFSQSDTGQQFFRGSNGGNQAAASGTAVPIAIVRSFDPPPGDGEENEPRVALAADGKPDTAWKTQRYNTRDFGRLKGGVGVIIELANESNLHRLEVSSPTTGWDAKVFVAAQAGASLAQWGAPVTEQQGIGGRAEFDLKGTKGKAVLLWITRLGDNSTVEVAEIALTA